jgi:hypothetical protein
MSKTYNVNIFVFIAASTIFCLVTFALLTYGNFFIQVVYYSLVASIFVAFSISNLRETDDKILSVSKAEIDIIKQDLTTNKIEYTPEERKNIFAIIAEKMQAATAQDYVAGLKQELQKQVQQDKNNFLFEILYKRLINQIDSLMKRGRYNLVIGMVIAIAGVVFLGLSAWQFSSEQNNDALMTQFVPKVTLTILTEIFALFFLRLYSNGLVEIKYWQNEITNLELKRIAYNGAMKESELNNLQTKIIESFAATERNFVLNKNQTTVELEKEKLHRQDISDLAAIIKNNNKAK